MHFICITEFGNKIFLANLKRSNNAHILDENLWGFTGAFLVGIFFPDQLVKYQILVEKIIKVRNLSTSMKTRFESNLHKSYITVHFPGALYCIQARVWFSCLQGVASCNLQLQKKNMVKINIVIIVDRDLNSLRTQNVNIYLIL